MTYPLHMKRIQHLVLISFLVYAASATGGCNQVNKILPRADGEWKVTQVITRHYTSSGLSSTTTLTYHDLIYKFLKNGTGNLAQDSSTQNFTWEVSDDQDAVTLCVEGSGSSAIQCTTYTVVESGKDAQLWATTDQATSDSSWTESDLTLERYDCGCHR